MQAVYSFLDDNGRVVAALTYTDLEARTRALAQRLRSEVRAQGKLLAPGDRVLLVFLPSLDFIVAFLGCLRAGLIAVPVYPPDPRKVKAHLGAFASIAASSGAVLALTHAAFNSAVSLATLKDGVLKWLGGAGTVGKGAGWPEQLTWATIDGMLQPLSTADAGRVPIDVAQPQDVAFLQYTSGSTAEPKGVMITHGNLNHNLASILRALEAGKDTIVVSWLPQYHDMGLIGSYCGVLACGGSGYYMSPISLIKRPATWIEAVARYRGTHLQSPNFGLALVAKKWRQSQASSAGPAIDLSCVRHLFNAAEPITVAALAAFLTTFVPYGFKPQAMRPGFGLAEHTVYVSDAGTHLLRASRAAFVERGVLEEPSRIEITDVAGLQAAATAPASATVDFVACGPVAPHARPAAAAVPAGVGGAAAAADAQSITVLIANPGTRQLLTAERAIGEVWIDSASKASGYWGQPEMSAAAFQGELLPAAEAAPPLVAADGTRIDTDALLRRRYLRTGDIGFISSGELFICGRAKDMVIIRGRNYFPQDIEATIERDPRVRPGCSAVFTAPAPGTAAAAAAAGQHAGIWSSGSATQSTSASAAAPNPVAAHTDDAPPLLTSSGSGGGSLEIVVAVVEVRDPGLSSDDLRAIATSLASAVNREHALPLGCIILLRPHTARKTTSGKIARRWNQRAYLSMETDPASPWHASTSAVLFKLLSKAAAAGDEDSAALEETLDAADVAAEVATPQAVDGTSGGAPGTAAAAAVATEGHPDLSTAPLRHLRGDALRMQLQQRAATLLREEPTAVDARASLSDLGMDSLMLTQYAALLQREFGLGIRDEQAWAPAVTINWLVEHADELREKPWQVVVEEVAPAPSGTAASAATSGAGGVDPTAPAGPGTNAAPIVRRQPAAPNKCMQYCPCCPCFY